MSKTVEETSLGADIYRYIRYQLRGRRGLIAAAVALAIPALWFSWPWLVVAGVAPILVTLAPCAIMCALGLCTMRACSSSGAQGSSCSKAQACDGAPATSVTATPLEVVAASQTADQTTAREAAKQLPAGTDEPLAIAAPSQVMENVVEVEVEAATKAASGRAGPSGEDAAQEEAVNQEKETLQ
ncbi:hypothetical protein [Chelativorans salis]|uniref:Uncharacterized protein n=1 Tax=Chelativorans salis TaxID=2978478 RepID=A0ABT2LVG0_9HYPH|nr:hypothetical protein [Chelativorans sp. EGI FJ00035]MCT7378510.1 hypothetical protein [Chelativorans sp. EGI FJ00035]